MAKLSVLMVRVSRSFGLALSPWHAVLFCIRLAARWQGWRPERLIDRQQELRRLLKSLPALSPLRYAEQVDGCGTELFQRVCELDLEGIVAKHATAPYVSAREETTWLKILNREYSQREGREELFERERHKEPVPGWHRCAIACTDAEIGAYLPPGSKQKRSGKSRSFQSLFIRWSGRSLPESPSGL